MKNRKVVIPVSGGLDSVTLLHYLAKKTNFEIYPVFIQYGQKHMYELECSMWQILKLQDEGYNVKDIHNIDMEFLPELVGSATSLINKDLDIPNVDEVNASTERSTAYVPYRNLIFISTIMAYAEVIGAYEIYYGSISEQAYNPSWDTTEEFTEAVNSVSLLNSDRPVLVRSPFSGITKGDEVTIGKELGIDFNHTWSSYTIDWSWGLIPVASPDNPASADRIRGFASAGIQDPVVYHPSVDWEEEIEKYCPAGTSTPNVELIYDRIKFKMLQYED